jgi:hypothetical protein
MPLLTSRRRWERPSKRRPAAGFCDTTRPFFSLEETSFTLPTEQCAARARSLAIRKVFPVSLGTMQKCWKVAVTAWLLSMITVQSPLPVQSPDHPMNLDHADVACAINVTVDPSTKACSQ